MPDAVSAREGFVMVWRMAHRERGNVMLIATSQGLSTSAPSPEAQSEKDR